MKTFAEFKEYLSDCAIKLPILEMATERKNIVARARNHQIQIAQHIIKINLYPNDSAVHHWESEVNAWVDDIQDLMFDRNKRLRNEQYFDILWKEPFEHTDYVRRSAIKLEKRGNERSNEDFEKIEDRIRVVYMKLCKLIASGEFVTIHEILK